MNKNNFSLAMFMSLLLVLTLFFVPVFVSGDIDATGGVVVDITDINDGLEYRVHTFLSNGTFVVSTGGSVQVLIVAGGGGGGGPIGGGGGAGGLIYNSSYNITGNITVIVGTGGAGGAASVPLDGKNGTNSSFGTLVARGGGGGAGWDQGPGPYFGGSGGGALSPDATGPAIIPGNGTPGQGNKGGYGGTGTAYCGGGGGAAGAVGVNGSTSVAGNGGAGLNYSINGTNMYYAGGGGGGGYVTCGQGLGGNGSGGAGGEDGGNNAGTAGTANTGGGGGAGHYESAYTAVGGAGGSGVVIIRYLLNVTTPIVNFITPTPSNSSHNNTQVNISMNCSGGNPNTRYYLWFDNSSGVNPVLVNSSTNYWVTNVTLSNHYYYRGNCYFNGIFGANSSVYSWFYDVEMPIVTLEPVCNEFNSSNFTIRNPFDNNVSFCFNFSDNIGLFAYEIMVTDGAGVLVFNKTNTSMSAVTTATLRNYSTNIISAGVYKVNVSISDIHTLNSINDYGLVESKDSLLFDTAEGNLVKISAVDSLFASSEKFVDRYDFGFSYDSKSPVSDRVFYVEALSGEVYYIFNSGFKAHFVIFNSEDFVGNWVDFEGVIGEPSVERVSDSKFRVTFKDLKETDLVFNSIGGLNIVNVSYSFVVGNYSSGNGSVLSGVNHSVWVNFSTGDVFNLSNVVLFYGGTNFTPICDVLDAGYNCSAFVVAPSNSSFSYYWYFSINGSADVFNLSFGEDSVFWNVTLCNSSLTNFTTLYFYFSDENNPINVLNASLELELFIWSGGKYNNKTLNFNFSDYLYNYSLCLPSNVTLFSDVYLKFVNLNGFTNRYYWYNKTINGTAQNIYLYVFNYTTGVSNLRITARNSLTYQYFSDVVASLERRYLSEGVYRVVQMDLSDDFGLLFFNVLEENTDYRIIFRDKDNVLLKTSSNLKFSCDAGVCDLTAVINPFGEVIISSNISWLYVYDNTTGLINVSWVDNNGLISSVRVWVSRQTITGEAVICNVNQSGTTGSYVCNVTGYSGEAFIRLSKTSSPESDVTGFWVKLSNSATSLSGLIGGPESAFWSFLLMIVISLLGLFSIAGAVILGVVGFVALYSFGLFSGISVVVVIVALVMGLVIAFKVKK